MTRRLRPSFPPRLVGQTAKTELVMIRPCVGILLLAACVTPIAASETEFSVDVMAVLSKSGCNAGTCHGNLNGKGGFKLSLRGQDPFEDYHALVFSSRGRRVNPTAPAESLILRKATGSIAHRGGIRFDDGSHEYSVLLDWLRSGAPGPSGSAPEVIHLEVDPPQAIVVDPVSEIQVRVKASFSDGTSRDVTTQACYEVSNLNAAAGPDGRISRSKFGETTLIVRYLQKQVPVPIAFTEARPEFEWSAPPETNPIDRHVFAKLKRLRINPSPLCDDTVFVRRAYLDAIGRSPTAEEARRFVADNRPDKRRRLIDHLLSRSEFADYWALKWADILRTEEKVLDVQGVVVFHRWIRDTIAEARPLDQFVRDLVTGVGSTFNQPAANYYRANRDPSTRGETTARLFLGTRLGCAKCHNHPFDRWTQDDYYRWSSLFSQLEYDLGENKRRDKLDKNEFAGDQIVTVSEQDEVRNPTTGDIAQPKFLGGEELSSDAADDRLQSLANWLTSPQNELFVKSQANFVWYQVMGRGLVEPVDDFRLTNPPSNPPLLDYLASELSGSGFDIRYLVRRIMTSRTYQLSADPTPSNRNDQTGHSRAYVHRWPAEVILDMQSDILAQPAEFVGYNAGIRAVQIPGVHRKRPRDAAPLGGDRFLKTFGKPERILACDCERTNETTLKQAFVLIGDGLGSRLRFWTNRLGHLGNSSLSDEEVIDQLYWSALSRGPTYEEASAAGELIKSAGIRAVALEDLAWALMNSKEFLFRH